jgi:hypothetical protein
VTSRGVSIICRKRGNIDMSTISATKLYVTNNPLIKGKYGARN